MSIRIPRRAKVSFFIYSFDAILSQLELTILHQNQGWWGLTQES